MIDTTLLQAARIAGRRRADRPARRRLSPRLRSQAFPVDTGTEATGLVDRPSHGNLPSGDDGGSGRPADGVVPPVRTDQDRNVDDGGRPDGGGPREAAGPDAGMSTVEYAVGTVVAAAFAAVLYKIVTGDSVVTGLTTLIDTALSSTF